MKQGDGFSACCMLIRFCVFSHLLFDTVANPTSIGPLWVGSYNDIVFEGDGFEATNSVVVSLDSSCTGDALSSPLLLETSLRFENVSDLPATGYLCWCPSAHPCGGDLVSFPFTLNGPSGALLDLSVVVGANFDVDVTGSQLSQDDRISFTESGCRQNHADTGFLAQDKPSMRHGQRFDAYVTTKTPLKICWCPGVRGCGNETMFSVHVGDVTARGPAFNHLIEVGAGQEFSVILNTSIATRSDFMRITDKGKCGPDFTQRLAYKVCDSTSCTYRATGPPNSLDGSTERWNHFSLSVKGEYSICWCHDASYDPDTGETYTAACRPGTVSAFSPEVGTILVSGVTTKEFVCDAWKDCELSFGNPGDVVVSMPEGTPCDGGKLFSGDNMLNVTNGKFTAPAGPPGKRALCYCEFATMGYCDHYSAYRQYLGTIVWMGAGIVNSDVLFQCNTKFCAVELPGIGFDPNDRLAMAKKCPSSQNEHIFRVTRFLHESAIFEVAGSFEADTYELCFCSYSENAAQGLECADEYKHKMGSLVVVSTKVIEEQETCILGLPCAITLFSVFPFQNGDAVWVHGEGFGPQPTILSNVTENSYQWTIRTDDVTASPSDIGVDVSYCSRIGTFLGVEENCVGNRFSVDVNVVGSIIVSSNLIAPLNVINPTPRAVTISVQSPKTGGNIYCAAAGSSQNFVPNLGQLANLDLADPVGTGVRRGVSQGDNAVHIDLGDTDYSTVRVWCTRDDDCSHGKCTLPHTMEGLVIALDLVSPTSSNITGHIGETVEVLVEGSLSGGAQLKILGKWMDCVGDDKSCAQNTSFNIPGVYSVHYCDRFIFSLCAIEVPLTFVTVAGVYPGFVTPPLLLPNSRVEIGVDGVGLDQAHELRSCNASSTLKVSMVESNFSRSVWSVLAGEDGTKDQLCSFFQDQVVEGTEFSVEMFRDCVVSEWEWQSECSVTCGKGSRLRTRKILVPSIGQGLACPEVDEEKPCANACPSMFLIGASVVGGDSILVDTPFQIDVAAENVEKTDRIHIVSRSEACGEHVVVTGSSCNISAPNHLLCGGGPSELKIRSPGIYRACFCDASSKNGCTGAATYDIDLEIYILVKEVSIPVDDKPLPMWMLIPITFGGIVFLLLGLYLVVQKRRKRDREMQGVYGVGTYPIDENVAEEVLREVWKSYNRLGSWKEGKDEGFTPTKSSFLGMALDHKTGTKKASTSHASGWTNSTGDTDGASTYPGDGEVPTADNLPFWIDDGEDTASDDLRLGETASCSPPDSPCERLHEYMFGVDPSEPVPESSKPASEAGKDDSEKVSHVPENDRDMISCVDGSVTPVRGSTKSESTLSSRNSSDTKISGKKRPKVRLNMEERRHLRRLKKMAREMGEVGAPVKELAPEKKQQVKPPQIFNFKRRERPKEVVQCEETSLTMREVFANEEITSPYMSPCQETFVSLDSTSFLMDSLRSPRVSNLEVEINEPPEQKPIEVSLEVETNKPPEQKVEELPEQKVPKFPAPNQMSDDTRKKEEVDRTTSRLPPRPTNLGPRLSINRIENDLDGNTPRFPDDLLRINLQREKRVHADQISIETISQTNTARTCRVPTKLARERDPIPEPIEYTVAPAQTKETRESASFKVMRMPGSVKPRAPLPQSTDLAAQYEDDYAHAGYLGRRPSASSNIVTSVPENEPTEMAVEEDGPTDDVSVCETVSACDTESIFSVSTVGVAGRLSLGRLRGAGGKAKAKRQSGTYRIQFGNTKREYGESKEWSSKAGGNH